MVRIEVGFDGGCPHDLAGVQDHGDGTFRILPSWRAEPGLGEECLGRTTRLGFRVVNAGAVATLATFLVDWQYNEAPPDAPKRFASLEDYMQHRDFCVVREPGSNRWRYVPALVEGSVTRLDLELAPGTTEVHWHPPYSYGQGEQFVADLRQKPWAEVERVGHSREGRNIWLARITDTSPVPKRRFLIRARSHAYESGGSYMMEGAVRFLTGDSPWAAMFRRDYEFYVLPMANPDGVYNGMGQLTAPRGSNLDYATDETGDPALAANLAALDTSRPHLYLDLHNFQHKYWDGILGLTPEQQERFLYYMKPIAPAGKSWFRRGPRAWPEDHIPESLAGFARRQYGSQWMALELGWFGRSPEEARAFGESAVWALLMIDWDRPPASDRLA
ncbi:MAG: hypothetical protein HPY83_07485 [Anaerolineae bacterium]|nr:hypothetical protein [Anaerolineae bacterium]